MYAVREKQLLRKTPELVMSEDRDEAIINQDGKIERLRGMRGNFEFWTDSDKASPLR